MDSSRTYKSKPSIGSRPETGRAPSDQYKSRPEDFQHHNISPGIPLSTHGAQNEKGSEKKLVQPTAQAQTVKKSFNPEAMVMSAADKYLNLGPKIALLLWIIWGGLSVVLLPAAIIGIGLVPGIIFNILLFSPKTVLRITELFEVVVEAIVDMIPVIGEFAFVVEVMFDAAELAANNVEIKMADWQKATIIAYDIVVGIILAIVIFTILISICSVTSGAAASVAGKAYDLTTGSTAYSTLSSLCRSVTN